jgi:phage terminase small subunit
MARHTTISPSHLSTASKRYYRNVVAEYELSEHQLVLLTQICEQRDIADRAWEVVSKRITYETSSGTRKAVPELTVQRQALALQARLLGQLDLPKTPMKHSGGLSPQIDRVKMRAEIERELAEAA